MGRYQDGLVSLLKKCVHFAVLKNEQAISKPKSIGANNNRNGILSEP
jgi:hypothetical protein